MKNGKSKNSCYELKKKTELVARRYEKITTDKCPHQSRKAPHKISSVKFIQVNG